MSSESTPLQLRLIQWYIKFLSFIWPSKAVSFLVKLFTKPRINRDYIISRYNKLGLFNHGDTDYIIFEGDEIFTYVEGIPQILLITGWESSAHRYQTIMDQLRQHNIGFLYFDLPAHGYSSGSMNHAMKTSRLIRYLLQKHSSIHTIIGHSFGGGAAYLALEEQSGINDQINNLITVGSPTKYQSIIIPFFKFLKVPEKLEEGFITKFSEVIERNFTDYDWKSLRISSSTKVFMFHDRHDKTVPVNDAFYMDEIHNVTITEGLGHRKIMHDLKVIETIISLLQINSACIA